MARHASALVKHMQSLVIRHVDDLLAPKLDKACPGLLLTIRPIATRLGPVLSAFVLCQPLLKFTTVSRSTARPALTNHDAYHASYRTAIPTTKVQPTADGWPRPHPSIDHQASLDSIDMAVLTRDKA
ncbi:hypothetical protein MN608_10577 [Microdochium nivale]|nr:hypothetical protein MN608_10577 [Microdochium nivale]